MLFKMERLLLLFLFTFIICDKQYLRENQVIVLNETTFDTFIKTHENVLVLFDTVK